MKRKSMIAALMAVSVMTLGLVGCGSNQADSQDAGDFGADYGGLVVAATHPPQPVQGHRHYQVYIPEMGRACNIVRKHTRKIAPFRRVAVILEVARDVGVAGIGVVVEQSRCPLVGLVLFYLHPEGGVVAVRHRVVFEGFKMGQREVRHAFQAEEAFAAAQAPSTDGAPPRQRQRCECRQ